MVCVITPHLNVVQVACAPLLHHRYTHTYSYSRRSGDLSLYVQLGGRCECALMVDILAAPNTKFRGPEVPIVPIMGSGGSQCLAHAVGNSHAMELVIMGVCGVCHTKFGQK